MSAIRLTRTDRQALEEILGYINFSSGATDANFLRSLNYMFGRLESVPHRTEPAWRTLAHQLHQQLNVLRQKAEPFRRSEQAEAVLALVFAHLLPAYRQHHRDLLFHQSEEDLFRPLFIGRVIEAALRHGRWEQPAEATAALLRELNDYVGYRPVPVLETEQKIQPYDHEFVRPIPLYIRDVGVGVGRYADLVGQALAVLQQTDSDILQQAYFDLDLLDELALDPRAYDFDHPVAKRPNDIYGEWDLRQLDLAGQSRRYVVRQVILDAILDWIFSGSREISYKEALFEGGAVLAGTILMGSGASGNRPDCHDSTVALGTLVQKVALYRDAFYERLLSRQEGRRRKWLQAEASRYKQPFGGPRQHVNQYVARLRAEQLQHLHLAEVYARLGATKEALREAEQVRTASARMGCQILCRLSAGYKALDRGDLLQAAAVLPEAEDLLHRAIYCGALADPWCILGFAGQYPLSNSALESVHDERVDKLILLLGEIFSLYTQLLKEAAVRGEQALQRQLTDRLRQLAQWWDRYATVEVSDVESISGQELQQSAEQAAAAIGAWRQAGAAAGDVAFWRQHAERFSSQTSYALVVETLLDHGDLVAAMALLVYWLNQAAVVGLGENGNSFCDLCHNWMMELWRPTKREAARHADLTVAQRWALARKFIDYLEANAEELAKVPRFALASDYSGAEEPSNQLPAPEESEDILRAAYEEVTYRDSADDGLDEAIFEASGDALGLELVHEAERIVDHLQFLAMLAELRHATAMASLRADLPEAQREEVIADWLRQTEQQHRQLLELAATIHAFGIPRPGPALESLVEYDRRRLIKETLLEHVVDSCVDLADTVRMLRASIRQPAAAAASTSEEPLDRVLWAILREDVGAVRQSWDALLRDLRKHPLQYVALWKGGDPRRVAATRELIRALQRLLAYLPRLGLLRQTFSLLDAIEQMEAAHPSAPGSITEFDQVFEEACRALVRCLVISSQTWPGPRGRRQDDQLVSVLDNLMELLHRRWLSHSTSIRLSVLEMVADQNKWQSVKRFIKSYGGDLFTQQFLQFAHLRAILHQGVDAWLQAMSQQPEITENIRLFRDLEQGRISRRKVVESLGLILEAVAENYPQYADYNSTTTQSDRGEMLYTLLDFLRLLAGYRRLLWHLRPVLIAHEVLIRCGHHRAAEIWQEALTERTGPLAQSLLEQYWILREMHGMHLRSIADQLQQRLVQPMQINRLRGLVHAAAEELRKDQPGEHFARLQDCIHPLVAAESGSGYELPAWLQALREEVERWEDQRPADAPDENYTLDPLLELPQTRLSLAQVRKELRAAMREYHGGSSKA